MFKNYVAVALRNVLRYKAYALTNIIGLAVGMACCILLLLWVQDELGYDAFHKEADQIYCVNKEYRIGTEVGFNQSTPYPLADAASEQLAGVAYATRVAGQSKSS